ncbi:MAG: MarC family protein [Elusimicrobiota bacterium]
MDLTLFVSSVFTLTLVMDPLGNMPPFVTALKGVPADRRRAVVTRELFIALGIMVFFLFFGKSLMTFLALDIVSLSVGGGIVLFLIAIQMIFPNPHSSFAEGPGGEPFIVPLAIPLVAGPSTLTTILIFSMKDGGGWAGTLAVVIVSWLINVAVLAGLSDRISRFMGARGLLAMEKLMGMILVTISVQMIMTGLRKFLAG